MFFALLALFNCYPQPEAAASVISAPADPLIVHEWGTFTSMQGSDGSGWTSWVRTVPRDEGADRIGPTEAEHYLFYRGLGTFELPLTVEVFSESRAQLSNGGDWDLPAVFALEVRGDQGRWMPLGAMQAGDRFGFDLGPSDFVEKTVMVEALKGAVQVELEAQGLYEDEAIAMVDTWSRQWFGSEGSRLIYLVPREVTDALLPLQIEPAPDELVRVLVGRLEYLTPEIEARTVDMLRQRIEGTTPERARARGWLVERGRFLEPHLHRAIAQSDDSVVVQSATELLVALNP